MMPSPGFPDHFSSNASKYALARPTYPPALAQWLAEKSPRSGTVWEAGCGSGQLTTSLADYFSQVIATDASAQQLAQAPAHDHITYRCVAAEAFEAAPQSIDAAVVAQAVHWFDLPAYYQAVSRVLVPGGLVALICYGRFKISQEIDILTHQFHQLDLAQAWPAQRRHVDENYANLDFPFARLLAPNLAITQDWDLRQLLDYIETWSALRTLEKNGHYGRYESFCEKLTAAWGNPTTARRIRWPLTVLAGRG